MYSKNVWKTYSNDELEKVMSFAEGYKKFISQGKTERECVRLAVKEAEENGYKNLDECSTLKVGDKVGIFIEEKARLPRYTGGIREDYDRETNTKNHTNNMLDALIL